MKRILLGFALTAVGLSAQNQPLVSVLTIETDNVVTYVGDIFDPTKLALLTSPQTPTATRAFTESITVGDVVSINGKPAKGLWQTRSLSMGYSPTAAPGSAIADAAEGAPGECKWAIYTFDGVLVGRFQEGGVGAHQITGGSGIFLGIHGTQTTVQTVQAPRRTSMTEDPSVRRSLGGGILVHTFHIAPDYAPGFVADGNPAFFHGNLSPVTAANPAHAGEVLIARVTNLGFTTPSVDPGAVFPSSGPFNVVNAPVEALVGGAPTDAVNELGWPGQVNVYRVDFQVPQGATAGMLPVQIRVGGIAGPAILVPVQ
jgi:uncharacterized protein (TIGR03437 family)